VWLAVGLVAVLGLVPAVAAAQVTITDWRGESVTVEEGAADSDGVRIVYHAAGEGPLVVFVHSITGPWFDWRHQMVGLSEHYRVVAMSTRGTDKSDKPEGVENYAMAKISSDVAAIIDHLGEERAIIVGQDSGGFYAWHFAMTHPEKTARLVSVGTIHPAGLIRELVSNTEQQQASMFQRGMQENPNAAADFGARMRSRPASPDDTPELAELRQQAYERLYPESIVNFYKANWPRPPFSLETEGFGFRIGEFPPVQAPTLLVYGRDSRPFTSRTLNDTWRWVDAPLTLLVLPGIGHGPHTQAPEIVTPAILEWLAAE
jgi:pimeloyl-ACP methyl ester carboxylesterase